MEFKKDKDGNLILDEKGNPIPIENKESDKVTMDKKDVQEMTDKKADEKAAKTVEQLIEHLEKQSEKIDAFLARPQEKQEPVPPVIADGMIQSNIHVKDIKHRVGLTCMIIGQKGLANPKDTNPLSDGLKELGIDEKSFLSENSIKTLNASLYTDGGVFVREFWQDIIIPKLESKVIVRNAGAPVIDISKGTQKIAKELTGADFYWVGEDTAITQSSPTYGSIELAEHEGGVKIPITNKLLQTGGVTLPKFIEDQMMRALVRGEDLGFLLGTGSVYQPLGIGLQIGTANDVAMTGGGSTTAATRQTDLIGLETELIEQNVDMDTCVWMMNPKVRQNLKNQVNSNSNPMPYAREIMSDNSIFGYPIFTTTQIPFVTTCNVYLFAMNYVIIGQGQKPTIEFIKNGSYLDSAGATVSGQNTRTSVFDVIEGVDIKMTQTLAGGRITGVTWGA